MSRPAAVRSAFALLFLTTVAACGVNAPPKTSPITETAVIGGTVRMTGAPAAPMPPVLVSVAGTMLTANVSRLGDFVIPNVPAGTLELRFTGEGVAAVLPAGGIAGGETVTMSVRLAAGGASIDSISRVRGGEAIVEGPIDVPPPDLPANTLIVGGRAILVPPGLTPQPATANTTPATLTPGTRVRVSGTVSAAGITAREIVILGRAQRVL